MNKSNQTTTGGIGFAGLLTIVFIVLKLTGYIDWSWVWVVSPVWISCLLSVGVIIIVFFVALILSIIKDN